MHIITNIKRKITFNNIIHKSYEAGIILEKWEIKSIKKNGFNINGNYILIEKNSCILINSHIKPIRLKNFNNEFNENRKRKLLLSSKQIINIKNETDNKKATIIASLIYWKNNFLKIEINICSGKKKYEKRNDKKEKDIIKEIRQLSTI